MTTDKYIHILSILNQSESNEEKAKLITNFIDDSIIAEFMKLLADYQKNCK